MQIYYLKNYQLLPPHHPPPHQKENHPPNDDPPLNQLLELYEALGGTELMAELEIVLFI